MIRIIIVDDSSTSRITLQKILTSTFADRFSILAMCESADEAKKAIEKYKPHLVFLDIEMPNKNGFELLKEIETIDFETVFTTSHPEYAIKAIKSDALDYLLKPIKINDLIETIKRFENKILKKISQNNPSSINENNATNEEIVSKIALPTEKGYEFLKINSILYCEANSNYCKIICVDGKAIVLAKTLKAIEQLLPPNLFHRIHKTYLVNINHVAKFNKTNSLEIELTNGKKLPVSFRKKENFLNVIKKQLY